MPVFNRLPTTLIPLFFAAALAANGPARAETAAAEAKEAPHAAHAMEWPGLYQGFLPCADCKGIKTSLALNANQSYLMITLYAGKSEREFTEKGKYTWSEQENALVLTSRDGKTVRHYLVGDNQLQEIDPTSGKKLDKHVLRKTDVMSKPPKHAH